MDAGVKGILIQGRFGGPKYAARTEAKDGLENRLKQSTAYFDLIE